MESLEVKILEAEHLVPQHVWRAAPAGANAENVYYSAFSVGVLTLGLLLVVESVRRKLDIAALKRPLFASVLDGVYRERTYCWFRKVSIQVLSIFFLT